ncbi:helix-turn-helix transcriptional regulator [Corynebacterium sp. AOP40-9SA-29]|uniref:helix-turn-helix transcriptional regulator n=1 Tax=Corynebacterium sp. AOP40-9SA-29 TaxID=3457677 RepID=UPI004033A934
MTTSHRLHHRQVREILSLQQSVPAHGGLLVCVHDRCGGGAELLRHLVTGSPGWFVVQRRVVTGAQDAPIPVPNSTADTLLLVEDLDRASASTVGHLINETQRRDRPARLMVVGTTSATDIATDIAADINVILPPLSVTEVATFCETTTGRMPAPHTVEQMHVMTGGRIDLLTELLGVFPAVPDTWGTALDRAIGPSTPELTALLQGVAVAGGPDGSPVPVAMLRTMGISLDAAGQDVFRTVLRTVQCDTAGTGVQFRDPRHRAAVLERTPPPSLSHLHRLAADACTDTDPDRGLHHRLHAALAVGDTQDAEHSRHLLRQAAEEHHRNEDSAAEASVRRYTQSDPAATAVALTRAGDLNAARLWARAGDTAASCRSTLAMHDGDRRRAHGALTGPDGTDDTGPERQRAVLAFADWDPRAMLEHATAAGDALLTGIAAHIIGDTGSDHTDAAPPHPLVDGWLALVNDDPLTARNLLSTDATVPTGSLSALWRDAWLARTHYVLGDFDAARRVVDRGLATGEAHGSVLLEPVLLWTGTQVAAFQGDTLAAGRYSARLPDDPDSFLIQRLPAAMSHMITTANSSDLVAALRVGESLARIGTEQDTQQPGFWPWEDVYAQCLVRAGRIRAADAVVTEAEQRAEHRAASRGTTPLPSLAAKLRVPRGSILLRRGEVDAGLRCFDEAVDIIADTPMRAYHSRILLEYGLVLRRLGRRRRADEIFSRAEEVFASMGAAAMVERCRRERRAAGISGSSTDVVASDASEETAPLLSTQEEQIAVMAADGSTNRDIAQELTLSAKTVEHHLTRVYRKLGVAGRRDLTGALQRR